MTTTNVSFPVLRFCEKQRDAAARSCIFLDVDDLAHLAQSCKKLRAFTKRADIWRGVSTTFAPLDGRFWAGGLTKEQVAKNYGLLKRVNATFWLYFEERSHWKKWPDNAEIFAPWKRELTSACKELRPREQFRQIAPRIAGVQCEKVNKLLTGELPKQIVELVMTCGAPTDGETFQVVMKEAGRLLGDRCPPAEYCAVFNYLIDQNLLPSSLDFLWDHLPKLPLVDAVGLMTKLLANKNFKVQPSALHDAVTKTEFYKAPVPIECLALLIEKTGVKPFAARPTIDQEHLLDRIPESTLDAGIKRYKDEKVLDFIKLMLKAGATPTSNTVRDFLFAHDPSRSRFISVPLPLEMVMRGVDLLLEAGVKFDEVSLSSLCLIYASDHNCDQLMEKLIKAGARFGNSRATFSLAIMSDVSLKKATFLLQYGAKPSSHTWGCLERTLKEKPEELEKFKKFLFPNGIPSEPDDQTEPDDRKKSS